MLLLKIEGYILRVGWQGWRHEFEGGGSMYLKVGGGERGVNTEKTRKCEKKLGGMTPPNSYGGDAPGGGRRMT